MTPEPARGEIWSFLPTVAGRDKPSALWADRVLVLSNSTAKCAAAHSHRIAGGRRCSPHARLGRRAVRRGPTARMVGGGLSGQPVYRPWLVERIGTVTETTLRSVFAVMVGYLDR